MLKIGLEMPDFVSILGDFFFIKLAFYWHRETFWCDIYGIIWTIGGSGADGHALLDFKIGTFNNRHKLCNSYECKMVEMQ